MFSEPAMSNASTPPTSPETRDGGPTEAMQKEEQRMADARRKQDVKREREMAAEREKDISGGPEVVDQKYKALEYLLSQSKIVLLDYASADDAAGAGRDSKGREKQEASREA